MEEYVGIVLRLTFIYLYALLLTRLAGKRSIGDMSSLDFVVVLILSDQFDNAFWGDTALAYAATGIAVILIWHTLLSFLSSRFKFVDDVVAGSKPTLIIRNGQWVRKGMDAERSNQEDIESGLRERGEDKRGEIKEANWEPSGQISAVKKKPAQDAQKQDLPRLKELFK